MDIYVLNETYSRTAIVEEFSTFIWTERYVSHGDFKLVVEPSKKMRALLRTAKYLAISESIQVMIIEQVLLAEDDEGAETLTVSGRTLTAFLSTRTVSRNTEEGLNWVAKGTVGSIITRMVSSSCVYGTNVNTYDIIPELWVNNAITDEPAVIDVAVKPQELYEAVRELCEPERLGFSIDLLPTSPRLRFRVYKGQVRPNVMFTSTLDNLSNESYLKSQTDYRNIAYVWAMEGIQFEIVPAPGVSPTISGVARRVLNVDASDIDATQMTDAEYTSALRRRGREALGAHKYLNIFDGQITTINPYKYRTHYFLGDTVSMMDEAKVKKQAVVSEYIWAIDAEGLRSYPTFETVE